MEVVRRRVAVHQPVFVDQENDIDQFDGDDGVEEFDAELDDPFSSDDEDCLDIVLWVPNYKSRRFAFDLLLLFWV